MTLMMPNHCNGCGDPGRLITQPELDDSTMRVLSDVW